MATDDFYVKFGSNLRSQFIPELEVDVRRVQTLINTIKTDMESLGGTRLPLPTPGTGAGSGVTPDKHGLEYANSAIREFSDGLTELTRQLAGTFRGIAEAQTKTQEMLSRTAEGLKTTVTGLNKSGAGKVREETGQQRRDVKGRYSSDPNATPTNQHPNSGVRAERKQRILAALDALDSGADSRSVFDTPRPSIAQVPTALISEAQFSKLIDSSKDTSKNTRKANENLERILAALNAQRAEGGGGRVTGPRAAARAGAADNHEANVLQAQIDRRERLAAIRAEAQRVRTNLTATTPTAANEATRTAAAAGSARFAKVLGRTGGEGEEYLAYLENAAKRLQDRLKGVPRLKRLREQFAQITSSAGEAAAVSQATTPVVDEAEMARRKAARAQARVQEATTVRDAARQSVELANTVGTTLRSAGATAEQLAAADQAKVTAERILAQAEEDLAKAELKEAGVTRALEKAVNDRAARLARETAAQGLSPKEAGRRAKMQRLDIAGSRTNLEGLGKEDLFGLAEAYKAQGLDVPGVGNRTPSGAIPRVSRQALIEGLSQANKRMNDLIDAGEQATAEGLERYRPSGGRSAVLSKSARQMAERLAKVAEETFDAEVSRIIRQDLQGGGISRRHRLATDDQQASISKADKGYGSATAPGGGKDVVDAAYAADAERQRRINAVARRETARALTTDPAFNPYSKAFAESGSADKATEALLRHVGRIRRATDAFDKLASQAVIVARRLQDAEDRPQRLARTQNALSILSQRRTEQLLGSDDMRRYDQLLQREKSLKNAIANDPAEAKALNRQLRELMKGMSDAFGINVSRRSLTDPTFRQGLEQREASRRARAEELAAAREARSDPTVLRASREAQATADALYGRRNSIGVGSGVERGRTSSKTRRTDSESLLPVIDRNAVFEAGGTLKDFKSYQNAERRRRKIETDLLEMQAQNLASARQGGGAIHTEAALNEQRGKLAQAYSNLLTAAERAYRVQFPTAVSAQDVEDVRRINRERRRQNPDAELMAEPLRTYEPADARRAIQQADAAARVQREANNKRLRQQAEVGGNLVDPQRLLRQRGDVTELERRVARSGQDDADARETRRIRKNFNAALARAAKAAEAEGREFDEDATRRRLVSRLSDSSLSSLARVADLSGNTQASKAFAAAQEQNRQASVLSESDKSTLTKSRRRELDRAIEERRQEALRQAATGISALRPVADATRSTATSDREQIEKARGILAKSGIQFSETLNTTLSKARTLPELVQALRTALKEGTLTFTKFKGDAKGLTAPATEGVLPPQRYAVGSETGAVNATYPTSEAEVLAGTYEEIFNKKRRRRARTTAAAAAVADSSEAREAVAQGQRGGFDADCCTKIVNAINRVNATLKAGVRVTPGAPAEGEAAATTTTRRTRKTATTAASDANAANVLQADANVRGYQPVKKEVLDAFFAGLPKDLDPLKSQIGTRTVNKERVANEQAVELAVQAVNRGFSRQGDIVDRLRQKLNLNKQAAQELAAQVKSGLSAARLAQGLESGSEQEQRRQEMKARRAASQQRRDQTETERSAASTRAEEIRVQELARAYGQLSTQAQEYLRIVQQMHASGAPVGELVNAERQFVNQAYRDQYAAGATGAERRSNTRSLLSSKEYGLGQNVPQSEVDRLGAQTAAQLAAATRRNLEGHQQEVSPLIEALFGGKGFAASVVRHLGAFLVRNFSAGLVFGVTNALQDMVSQALDTESTFVRVSGALEATGRSTGHLRTQLQSISTDYGVALKDVYTTAAGLTGVFKSNDALAGGTRVAAQLEIISRGALNATEAMKSLAAVNASFGDDLSGASGTQTGVKGLEHVADVLTTIQDRLGVNIEDTVEGMGRIAGQAKIMDLSLEEAATYAAAISKATGQSGQASGEQLSRILSVLQTGRGQAVLAKNLPGTGIQEALQTRDYGAALRILMANYNGLTKAQQANIATTLGGQRQAAAINALLSQGATILDTVTAATNSYGTANRRAADISKQIANQFKILQQDLVDLASNLVRTGVLDWLGLMLKVTTGILKPVNTLLSLLNDLADSNPLTRFGKSAVASLLGFALAIKVLRIGLGALRNTLGGLSLGRVATASAEAGQLPLPFTTGARGVAEERTPARIRDVVSRVNPLREFGTQARSDLSLNQRLIRGTVGRAGGGFERLGAALQVSGQSLVASRALTEAEESASRAASVRSGWGKTVASVGSGVEKMGSGLTRLSNTMSRTASSAIAANAGMLAFSLGLGLLFQKIAEEQDLSQFLRDKRRQREDARNPSKDKNEDGNDPNTYLGRSRQIADKYHPDNIYSPGNLLNLLGDAVRHPMIGVHALRGDQSAVDRDYARLSGDVTSAESDARLKNGKGVRVAINDLANNQINRLNSLAATAHGNVAALDDAAKKSSDEIYALREQIDNSKMSDEQKASAQALVDIMERQINATAESVRAKVKGLGDINGLTEDGYANLQTYLSTVSSAGASGPQFSDLIKRLADPIGAVPGSTVAGLVDKLGAGSSAVERSQTTVQLLRTALTGIQNRMAVISPDSDEYKNLQSLAVSMLGQLNSAEADMLQQTIDAATAMATDARNSGDIQAAVAAMQPALDALDAEILRQKNDAAAVAGLMERRRQILKQAIDDQLLPETMAGDRFRAGRHSATALADRAAKEAADALKAYQAGSARGTNTGPREYAPITSGNQPNADIFRRPGVGQPGAVAPPRGSVINPDELNQRKVAAIAAAAAAEEAHFQDQVSALQLQMARTLIASNKAQIQATIDSQNVARALKIYRAGSKEYNDALAQQAQNQQAANQLAQDQTRALAQTNILRIAPGDAVAIAAARLKDAKDAQTYAKQFKENSTQYQAATQAVISAQRDYDGSLRDVLAANAELGIAIANAAGNTVLAARRSRQEADRQYRQALTQAGGNRNAAAVVRARAAAVTAAAGERDAIYQDRLDTVNFNLEIGKITATTAIKQLQDMLKATNLTKQQRRSLLLQIKQLQDQIEGQFNIGDIINPTIYEVRRYSQSLQGRGSTGTYGQQGSIDPNSLVGPNSTLSAAGMTAQQVTNNTDNRTVNITINGGDLAAVTAAVSDAASLTTTVGSRPRKY